MYEYFPVSFGEHLPPYAGFDAGMDPRVDVFFSAAAFKLRLVSFSFFFFYFFVG
jgi:hypothetical protein